MPHLTSPADPDPLAHLSIATTTHEDVAEVVLRGEGDGSTVHDLDVALDRVELDVVTRVHLDVTELGFADTATIRRLVVFARQARGRGKDITTLGASRTLRTATGVLGFEDDLNIT
jgi:anti-anti-sigma factor